MYTSATLDRSPTITPLSDATTHEALRRVVDEQIGPRQTGAVYRNIDGDFEVLDVIRDPARARELLSRRSAQWALLVRDTLREDGQPFVVGTAWTTSDHVIRQAGVPAQHRQDYR